MLVKFLRGVRRLTIFSKKKDDNTSFSDIDEYINNSDNLNYLIKKIKKQNANRNLLLPPQSENDRSKLTVVMEMDEVLSYTFSPDEEGYLLAPIRKYDFYREYEEYDAYLSIYKRKNLDNFLNYVSEEC
jgi:CTD small phosphatase-like protein 2